MSGYKFDLFISYARRGSVQKWLLNHFYDKLVECLTDEIAPAPKVYMDRSMPSGVHWPSDLQNALRRSKIMLQLLTPPYFASSWCMAEWQSMLARQKVLGLAGIDVPQGLVYPILYSDSDNFPVEGKQVSWRSFKDYAYPDPGYQGTTDYFRFHKAVTELARDLVQLLKQVPEWQADWPIVTTPDPVILPDPPIPRFDR